jgi:hypothetical protein
VRILVQSDQRRDTLLADRSILAVEEQMGGATGGRPVRPRVRNPKRVRAAEQDTENDLDDRRSADL